MTLRSVVEDATNQTMGAKVNGERERERCSVIGVAVLARPLTPTVAGAKESATATKFCTRPFGQHTTVVAYSVSTEFVTAARVFGIQSPNSDLQKPSMTTAPNSIATVKASCCTRDATERTSVQQCSLAYHPTAMKTGRE